MKQKGKQKQKEQRNWRNIVSLLFLAGFFGSALIFSNDSISKGLAGTGILIGCTALVYRRRTGMLMALSALAALLWLLLPSIRQASWQDIIGFLPVPVLIYGLLSGIRKKQVTESRPAAKRGRKPAAKKKEGQSLTRKAPTGKAKAQPAVNKKSKAAGS